MKNALLSCIAALLLTGCSSKVPLRTNYLSSHSKVGLLIHTEIESTKQSSSGGFGLVGVLVSSALTPKSKYDEALAVIGPDLDPTTRVTELYEDSFAEKGKEIILMRDDIDWKQLRDFPKGGRKYFNKDLRFLKDEYQVDEIMLVRVVYGLYATYTYGIEISRYGKGYIFPEIIDLRDNSIIYKDRSVVLIQIKGEWNTPPDYENLKRGIDDAIGQVLTKEKMKY